MTQNTAETGAIDHQNGGLCEDKIHRICIAVLPDDINSKSGDCQE